MSLMKKKLIFWAVLLFSFWGLAFSVLALKSADVNGDGKVNGADLILVLKSWQTSGFIPEDIDENQRVNNLDAGWVIKNFGQTSPSPSVSPVSATDWPTLAHDNQRTSYTPQEIRPPYRYLWRWHEVPFASRTQPVVANGILYIGSVNNKMYALEAKTDKNGGPPQIKWSYQTNGPIRATAAVYEGKVIFGSHDSYIYALNAQNGALIWRYKTKAGLMAAPLVFNNIVYIGSRDGIFYALNSQNGSLVWWYQADGPISIPASLSGDNSKIFFGTENMSAYALKVADGSLLWKKSLHGQSLMNGWPVVVGDKVIFRTMPGFAPLVDILQRYGDEVMDRAGSLRSNWEEDWNLVRPQIISHLNQNPEQKTFYVLNINNGEEAYTAPVLYTSGDQETPTPPITDGVNVYVVYRARHGIQTDGGSTHVSSKYDCELGKMDIASGDIAPFKLASGQTWNDGLWDMTSDEPNNLLLGGKIVYIDHWTRIGGQDITNGISQSTAFAIANVADNWPECFANCPGRSGPMPFFPNYPFDKPRTGEGPFHGQAVIADGVLFWLSSHNSLGAIAGTVRNINN